MNQSVKAACVALSFIIVLTCTKFFLYWLSGSVAVLSEAWHSFSDICTTLLVLVSILVQLRQKKTEVHAPREAVGGSSEKKANLLIKFLRWGRNINPELHIALFIGFFLLAASGGIIWNTWTARPVTINKPLITGLIFIVLSFGSFFISRFEQQMAQEEDSAALKADSQHNRADMVIALLTGFSLILYYFGYDVDRYVGTFIAVYIFAFASELIVNTFRSILFQQEGLEKGYDFRSIAWKLFQLKTYKKLYDGLETQLDLSEKFSQSVQAVVGSARLTVKWGSVAAVIFGCLAYVATAFYSVKVGEGVLLFRFGRLVSTEAGSSPGLHLKFPYPIDRVEKINTGRINTLYLGNAKIEGNAMIWSTDHGDMQSFVSADNNLFLPYVVLHYRITDVKRYYSYYSSTSHERIITVVSQQLLNKVFTTHQFYDLILAKRKDWTEHVKEQIQEKLNTLDMGVELVEFCLKDLHPPIELAGAFEEVVAATQLKEAALNDAERRVISLMSRERIEKLRTLGDAKSYVIEKENVSQGEVANYLLRYEGYKAGGQVMKDILFLDSAKTTLEGKKLFLVDPDSGIDDRLIYLENYVYGTRK